MACKLPPIAGRHLRLARLSSSGGKPGPAANRSPPLLPAPCDQFTAPPPIRRSTFSPRRAYPRRSPKPAAASPNMSLRTIARSASRLAPRAEALVASRSMSLAGMKGERGAQLGRTPARLAAGGGVWGSARERIGGDQGGWVVPWPCRGRLGSGCVSGLFSHPVGPALQLVSA